MEKINALEDDYKKLSDKALREKTEAFKRRLANGETVNDIIYEASIYSFSM